MTGCEEAVRSLRALKEFMQSGAMRAWGGHQPCG